MLISFSQLCLLFAAGALLLPTARRRALALVGATAAGLALAAFSISIGEGQRDLSWHAAQVRVPSSFLQLNSGLLLLGVGLLLLAAARELRAPRESRVQAILATLALLVGSILAMRAIVPLSRFVSWQPILGSALLLGAVGWLLSTLARLSRFLEPWRRLDAVLLERRPASLIPALPTTADLIWFGGVAAAALAVCFAPSLRAVALATVITAVGGHVLLRRSGAGSPIPVAALLALFIIPVSSWFRAIAGDANPSLAELAVAPFSTAAEIQIFPWVCLVSLGLAALWPLHGLIYPLIAPVSAVLLIRLGAGLLPEGMEHWAPLFMPVTLLGLWHAAATLDDPAVHRRRVLGVLTASALFGVLAGNRGALGAWWLIGSGVLYPWLMSGVTLARVPLGLGRLIWLIPAYGTFMVVEGGLLSQVTWTVLFALGVAVAGWRATMRLYLPR